MALQLQHDPCLEQSMRPTPLLECHKDRVSFTLARRRVNGHSAGCFCAEAADRAVGAPAHGRSFECERCHRELASAAACARHDGVCVLKRCRAPCRHAKA